MKKLTDCTINELLNLLEIAIHDDDHDFEVAVNEALEEKGYFDFGPIEVEPEYEDEVDETGFNPYMGGYDYDC